MRTLRRLLPSPIGLVFFEAAARLQSFSLAAKEMAVTQAAVSRQIRLLEDQIGVPLFRRLHRRVELTPEGVELAQSVSLGLNHIAQAVARIEREQSKSLTVAANVAVMAMWLRPRIMSFLRQVPELDIRLIATDQPLDYAGDRIDLALECSSPELVPQDSRLVFPEVIWAVASPQLARQLAVASPQDLLRAPLLHEDQMRPDWVSWADWLRAMGYTAEFHRIVRFNNYPMLIEAAVEGEGVALGWETLIDPVLESGRLVKILPQHLVTGRAYYLVRPMSSTRAREAARLAKVLWPELDTIG